jgi:hypothetical protein
MSVSEINQNSTQVLEPSAAALLPARSYAWMIAAAATPIFLAIVCAFLLPLPANFAWLRAEGILLQGMIIGWLVSLLIEGSYLRRISHELQASADRDNWRRETTDDPKTAPANDWAKSYWRAWETELNNPGPDTWQESCNSAAKRLADYLFDPSFYLTLVPPILCTVVGFIGVAQASFTGEMDLKLLGLAWVESTVFFGAGIYCYYRAARIVDRWQELVLKLTPLRVISVEAPMPAPIVAIPDPIPIPSLPGNPEPIPGPLPPIVHNPQMIEPVPDDDADWDLLARAQNNGGE